MSALQHWVMRAFACGHLIAMYTAVITWLPGLPSLLHPTVAERVLEALGVWHPSVAKGMLPVLLALVLVSMSSQVHVPCRMSFDVLPSGDCHYLMLLWLCMALA